MASLNADAELPCMESPDINTPILGDTETLEAPTSLDSSLPQAVGASKAEIPPELWRHIIAMCATHIDSWSFDAGPSDCTRGDRWRTSIDPPPSLRSLLLVSKQFHAFSLENFLAVVIVRKVWQLQSLHGILRTSSGYRGHFSELVKRFEFQFSDTRDQVNSMESWGPEMNNAVAEIMEYAAQATHIVLILPLEITQFQLGNMYCITSYCSEHISTSKVQSLDLACNFALDLSWLTSAFPALRALSFNGPRHRSSVQSPVDYSSLPSNLHTIRLAKFMSISTPFLPPLAIVSFLEFRIPTIGLWPKLAAFLADYGEHITSMEAIATFPRIFPSLHHCSALRDLTMASEDLRILTRPDFSPPCLHQVTHLTLACTSIKIHSPGIYDWDPVFEILGKIRAVFPSLAVVRLKDAKPLGPDSTQHWTELFKKLGILLDTTQLRISARSVDEGGAKRQHARR